MGNKYNIFISYRRKGGYDTAKLIYDRLRMDGYSVSFDIDTLENGNFDNELEKRVKKCRDFLIVLSPGIFDCFSEANYDAKDDWVRREIAYAINAGKNIVPLMPDDFAYPKKMPLDIKEITRKNSIDLNPKHFEAAYEKLKQTFLRSKPHWKIRYKKKIRRFIAMFIMAFIICLAYFLFTIYQQKNLEVKEAQMAAQKADAMRIEREVGFERAADSLRFAIEIEAELKMMHKIDSIKNEKEKLERIVDSLKKSVKTAEPLAKSAAKPTATKTQATKKSKK
jgi:hypothetical protein